ncbi:lipoate--protein ligase [Prolixibacteraceae bacterium JC049]|nr:lipoate--protein ligase [Prolixibacteraceae bacterium JC049]
MQFIFSPTNNPYFNLAAEEYLLKNFKNDICFIYINRPAVIVGKHQNALKEVNYAHLKSNNVPIIRRLSGGGTVYHDEGNINFSFHQQVADITKVNYRDLLDPVRLAIENLGIEATFSKRNDILIGGKKISGNAEHVFKKRLICHATLLFDTDLDELEEAIFTDESAYQGKAVKSVRSRVTNIVDHLKSTMDATEFSNYLLKFLMGKSGDGSQYNFSEEDNKAIEQLIDEKYSQWDWNFGYSPGYSIQRELTIGTKQINALLEVKKGHVFSAFVTMNNEHDKSLTDFWMGKKHNEESTQEWLKMVDSNNELAQEDLHQLVFELM